MLFTRKNFTVFLFFLFAISPFQSKAAKPVGEDLYVQIKPAKVTKDDLDAIKATGFGGVRFSILWHLSERKKDLFSYDKPVHRWRDGRVSYDYGQLVEELVKRDLKMLVLLHGGNPLYTGPWQDFLPPDKKGKSRRLLHPPRSSDQIESFGRFAANTVSHFSNKYGQDRFTWLIWNEPNLWGFHPPKPDAAAFAKLLTSTCETIKEAEPDAIIAGPGFATDPNTWWKTDLNYVKNMLNESNALNCLDAITFHPYRPVDPETVEETYNEIKQTLAPYQPAERPIPIAVDEWGYSYKPDHIEYSLEKQGIRLVRAYLLNQLYDIPFTNIYEWRNRGTDLTEREDNFGLVTNAGEPKPAFNMFAKLLQELKGYTLKERIYPSGCTADKYILLYENAVDIKAAVWRSSNNEASLNITKEEAPETIIIPLTETVKIFSIADNDALECHTGGTP